MEINGLRTAASDPPMTTITAAATEEPQTAPRNCRHCSGRQSCPVTRIAGDCAARLQLREHSFRAGDVLETQGATATAIRIIKSGATLLRRASGHGDSQAIGVFGRGTVIGGFGLLGRANPVTQVGLLDGRYCDLPIAALRRHGLDKDPEFLGHMADAMAHAIESHCDWCQRTRGDSVARQLIGILLHLSELQNSRRVRLPTQTTLAELLGTTRESITRAFARLEKDGEVSRCGRHYCDLHLPRLVEPAGVLSQAVHTGMVYDGRG